MRYLLFILLLISFTSNTQIVEIPDPIMKYALVNFPVVDLDGDGSGDEDVDTNDDGEIQVSEAEAVINLLLFAAGTGINDMEGIQSFINLEVFRCNINLFTSIDVSTMTNLRRLTLHANQLISLDVTQNLNLEYLYCSSNQIESLDVSQNLNLSYLDCGYNNLTSLDLLQNQNLEFLAFGGNDISSINLTNIPNLEYLNFWHTDITELDITNNPNLKTLSIVQNDISYLDLSQNLDLEVLDILGCQFSDFDISHLPNITRFRFSENPLTYVNLQNGNNENFIAIRSDYNYDLFCIQVDNEDYSNSQECEQNGNGWCVDSWTEFSENCQLGLDDFNTSSITIYPNPVQDLLTIDNTSTTKITSIKIYDVIGRLVLVHEGNVGQIDVSNITSGLLFVEIETDEGILTKKIIKE